MNLSKSFFLQTTSLLKIVCLSSLLIFSFSPIAFAADGDLDTSFGTNGQVNEVFALSASARAVAIQPDQKIVVVGVAVNPSGTGNDIGVARFNSNGQLDPDFGTNGVTFVPLCPGDCNDAGNDVAIDPTNGSIVIAANRILLAVSRVAVVRLDSTGKLDPSFGTGGISLPDAATADTSGVAVKIQDGKILVTGKKVNPTDGRLKSQLMRLLPNGSLDPSFGNAGSIFVDFLESDHNETFDFSAIDGQKIYLVGQSSRGGLGFDSALSIYSPTGVFEKATAFSIEANEPPIFAIDGLSKVVRLSDGRIVAYGGISWQGPLPGGSGVGPIERPGRGVFLARYSSEGMFLGKALIETALLESGNGLGMDTDGRFYTVIQTLNTPPLTFRLVRWASDLTVDTNFGSKQFTLSTNRDEQILDVAAQNDGKVVVVGRTTLPGKAVDFAVLRFLGTVQNGGGLPPTVQTPTQLLTAQIVSANTLIKGLKLTVVKKDLAAQKSLRTNLKKLGSDLVKFIKANKSKITPSSSKVDLTKLADNVSKAITKVLKLNAKTFTSDKKNLSAAIGSLKKGYKT